MDAHGAGNAKGTWKIVRHDHGARKSQICTIKAGFTERQISEICDEMLKSECETDIEYTYTRIV